MVFHHKSFLLLSFIFILINSEFSCSEDDKNSPECNMDLNKIRNLKEGKYPDFINGLKTHSFKNVIFMTGAGTSTSAGIPDFRSENGLFAQLQKKYNLSSPRQFFEIETFLENPKLYYDFSKEFKTEKYSPTTFHYFMGFLDSKGLLKYLFTQNIDGLDLRCGIDKEKIIFAHGNFLEAECPQCHKEFDINVYNQHVDSGEVLYCDVCGAPVKSKVVFYGESLSERFFKKSFEVMDADLVIICGTGLEVAPFNKLAYAYTNQNAYRVVINKIRVGQKYVYRGFDYESDTSKDIFLMGTCDSVAEMIAEDAGWKEEFDKYLKEHRK